MPIFKPGTFVCFDTGLSYLPHGCITMRGCVAYIRDANTLTFDLKVKFTGFFLPGLYVFRSQLDFLTLVCITIGQCVTYFHDICTTSTFGLNIKIYFHYEFVSGQDRLWYMIF